MKSKTMGGRAASDDEPQGKCGLSGSKLELNININHAAAHTFLVEWIARQAVAQIQQKKSVACKSESSSEGNQAA